MNQTGKEIPERDKKKSRRNW